MPKATKQQLREEIARLRHVGRQMSNVLFNVEQRYRPGKPVEISDASILMCKQLQLEWDGIQCAERRTL